MIRSSFWAILAAASFSSMAAVIKLMDGVLSPLELVFYRSIFTAAWMLAIALCSRSSLRPRNVRAHLRRSLFGAASVSIWFFTLGKLPLGTNITLTYTTSLFLAVNFIILAIMNRQPPAWGNIGAVLLGFAGVIIVMQPTVENGCAVPALLCLTVAFIDLLIYWEVHRLNLCGEPSWRIVFYFSVFCCLTAPAGVILLEDGFHPLTPQSLPHLLAMGALAAAGMLSSTRAWGTGNMLLVGCLGFSAIPFSEILSCAVFGNASSGAELAGSLLIVIAGMIAVGAAKKKQDREKSARPAQG